MYTHSQKLARFLFQIIVSFLEVPSQAACCERPCLWRLQDASLEVDIIAWLSSINLNSFEVKDWVKIKEFYFSLKIKPPFCNSRGRVGFIIVEKSYWNSLLNFLSTKSNSLTPTAGDREFCKMFPILATLKFYIKTTPLHFGKYPKKLNRFFVILNKSVFTRNAQSSCLMWEILPLKFCAHLFSSWCHDVGPNK